MQSTLVRNIGVSVAVVVMFTVTYIGLFVFSKPVFVKILVHPRVALPTLSQKEILTRKQFVYWNFHTSEINRMILDLADQRAAFQKREEVVAAEEARIVSERKENERIRDEINRTRKELSGYIVEIKGQEVARLREQVAILSNMAPENIVAVFNEKPDTEVVKFLALMKPDMVAQILEAMMAQPAEPNKPTPQKRAAMLMDLLKRLRQNEATTNAPAVAK
jgi:hypothetical protein